MRPPHRRATLVAALLAMTLLVPGCAFFGLPCGPVGSALQKLAPAKQSCANFDGDCCDRDPFGFLTCGSLDMFFFFSCGTVHETECACAVDSPFPSRGLGMTPLTTYAAPPFTFDLGLDFAGMSAAHRLTFDVVPDVFQTYQGTLTYPAGFTFNGFTAFGPPGTQIGSYGIDIDADDKVDFAIPIRALGADAAYVDVNIDGQATVVDPTIAHVADSPTAGAHTFNLLLPGGGDTAKKLARSFRSFRVHVLLNAGILRNPETPGMYGIGSAFTSVDPTTGDATDGAGQGPLTIVVPPVGVMIAPSPLGTLDHFLCYKTKPSKGNICSNAAATNRGGLCASDADCGNVAGACVKNKLAKGLRVDLADELSAFTTRPADVKKPLQLCTPADKNGEGRHDDVTHLRGYQIKDAGSPPRVPRSNLTVLNQLGTIVVTTKAPDMLYVPAAKALGAPAAPLGSHVVDDYACYKAKVQTKRCAGNATLTCKKDVDCGIDGPCLGKFPKGIQVTVADQFTAPKLFDVKKPTRLCNPALANGGAIDNPDGHLMCYQVKAAKGQAPHAKIVGTIHTTGLLGRDRLDTAAEAELCVPSLLLS